MSRYPVVNLGQILPSIDAGEGAAGFFPTKCEQIPENRLLDRYNCERKEFERRYRPAPPIYAEPLAAATTIPWGAVERAGGFASYGTTPPAPAAQCPSGQFYDPSTGACRGSISSPFGRFVSFSPFGMSGARIPARPLDAGRF